MIIGVTSAYIGGSPIGSLMVVTDVFLILPVLPLLILLASYLPPGVTSLIIVLTITSWAFQARQLRSQGLAIRNRDFLLAARVRGERPLYIILVEIVPTMTSLLAASFLALAVFEVGFAASLQFLGPGQQQRADVGHDALQRAAGRGAGVGQRMVGAGAGRRRRLMGAGFALLNYAFDEIGNPALRPVRRRAAWPKRLLEVVDLSVDYVTENGATCARSIASASAVGPASSWASSANPDVASRRCCSGSRSCCPPPGEIVGGSVTFQRAGHGAACGRTSSATCAGASTRW